MARTKTEFKYFTVMNYKQEEAYLRKMHNSGWALSRIIPPCVYCFTECTPEDVVYQLDYNTGDSKNKDAYVQMFKDLGWDYLLDCMGYSYFKKPVAQMTGREEIFCDDASRLDMMKRVLQGRGYPLLCVFFVMILPQLFMLTSHASSGSFQKGLAITFLVLFAIYVVIFVTFGFQYFSYEKKIREPDKAFKRKYIALCAAGLVLCVCVAFTITRLFVPRAADYTVNTLSNQYSIGAEYLDETLTHALSLQEGDQLDTALVITAGEVQVRIGMEGEDAVYEGTHKQSVSFTCIAPKSGSYTITITGKAAEGSIGFQVQ